MEKSQIQKSQIRAGAVGQNLSICRLDLSNFRCYEQLRLELDSRLVVVTGENGAGKTNLLESLSFLSPGRGLRHASAGEILRYDSLENSSWAVAAQLSKGENYWNIGVGRDGRGKRHLHLNGTASSSSEVAQLLSVLWLTPAMDRIFMDGASGRRRFMDRLTLGQESQHGRRVAAYERAMRERIILLRGDYPADPQWLTALEEEMAQHGAQIASARHIAMGALDKQCHIGFDHDTDTNGSSFPRAHLLVVGLVEDYYAKHGWQETRSWIKNTLLQNRQRDQSAGTTVFGVHKSDFSVLHGGKNRPAEDCSTGEQKAVLISIILAQAYLRQTQTGQAPILLLDEIAAHLDQRRRIALFSILTHLGSQCWMTGTDHSLFNDLGCAAQYLHIDNATCVMGRD